MFFLEGRSKTTLGLAEVGVLSNQNLGPQAETQREVRPSRIRHQEWRTNRPCSLRWQGRRNGQQEVGAAAQGSSDQRQTFALSSDGVHCLIP